MDENNNLNNNWNNDQYDQNNNQSNNQNNGQYDQNNYYQNEPPQMQQMPPQRPERKPPKKRKTPVLLIVAVIVLAFFFLFSTVFSFVMRIMTGTSSLLGTSNNSTEEVTYSTPYIAELAVDGVIQSVDEDSLTQTATYHHRWTVDKIKSLKNDNKNRGLIMYVNTPGGGVYESDELYLAIKDYKESTGRPVYTYMASEAASGGYYISSPSDKIYANRNCWTGSIGVTIGTIYDITGLLEKYGVKAVPIHAGKNKGMGSYTEELTKEQQEILQSLVDEAYDQFVGIVADGRNMSVKEVKKLADGRIYTAKQAKENKLIDEIGTFEEAVDDMKKTYELTDCPVQNIKYPKKDSLIRDLLGAATEIKDERSVSELDYLKALMEENGKFSVAYISEIQK